MKQLFNTTKEEDALIKKIVHNAKTGGIIINSLQMRMSLTACHANGCPLDLERMSQATCEETAHDLHGIHNTIDTETGELQGGFLPRFHAQTMKITVTMTSEALGQSVTKTVTAELSKEPGEMIKLPDKVIARDTAIELFKAMES